MHLKPTRMAAAIALSLATLSAHAQTVTQRMTGRILDNATTAASGDSLLVNPINGSAQTGGLFSQDSMFHGDVDTGTTIVRVVAGKDHEVSSLLEYTATVTNSSSLPIDLGFAFFIGRGRVGIDHYSSEATFNGKASLAAEIRWDNTPLWSVYLEMQGSGSGSPVFTPTVQRSARAQDFKVDSFGSQNNLYYDPYAGNLGLGILGAQETKTLTYRIEGQGFYTTDAAIEAYGYGGQAVVGNSDPFDFTGRPVDGEGNPLPGGIQPIPEPQTYAMVSLGLVVLGLAARRRRLQRGHAV